MALLFVVRVWRRGSFRASVRRVDDEDTHLFLRADELARYLEASAATDDWTAAKRGRKESDEN